MKAEDMLRHLYGSDENVRYILLNYLLHKPDESFYLCNISAYVKKTKLSHITIRKCFDDFKTMEIVKEYRSGKSRIFVPIKDNTFFRFLHSLEE